MKRIWFMKEKKDVFVCIFYMFLVFGTLLATGTITSGFHLVDDHEFITYTMKIGKDKSRLWDCVYETVCADLSSRFRPLYHVVRILLTAVIGMNLSVWSVIMGIQTVLTLSSLYLCARELRLNRFYSILFSLFVMVGPQSAVWWKLGPQENTGMFLFATGFYFILKGYNSENKNNNLWKGIFFILLSSLYKESFMLLIPFVVIYMWIYNWEKADNNTSQIKGILYQNRIQVCVLSLIFLLEISFIIFFVDTNSLGYIGLDPQVSAGQYVRIWGGVIIHTLKFYVFFAIATFILLLTARSSLRKIGTGFILMLVVMLPQIFLYCKSGIEERYVIPWSFGYALFFVVTIGKLPELVEWRKKVYIFLSCAFLTVQMIGVISEARYFTYRGKSVTAVMDVLIKEADENTNILAAYSPYIESDYTISLWMEYHGNGNVYFWDENSKTCADLDGPGKGRTATLAEMDIILFYNSKDRHYLYDPTLDLSDYVRTDYGTLVVCRKEQS